MMKRECRYYLFITLLTLSTATHSSTDFHLEILTPTSAYNILLTATGIAGLYITTSCCLAKQDGEKKQTYWPAAGGTLLTIASLLVLIYKPFYSW